MCQSLKLAGYRFRIAEGIVLCEESVEVTSLMANQDSRFILRSRAWKRGSPRKGSKDEARMLGRIMESQTQSRHRSIQQIVEIDEDIFGPEPPAQFLPRDQFARMFQQRGENRKRLLAKLDFYSALAEDACLQVCFIFIEPNNPLRKIRFRHGIDLGSRINPSILPVDICVTGGRCNSSVTYTSRNNKYR